MYNQPKSSIDTASPPAVITNPAGHDPAGHDPTWHEPRHDTAWSRVKDAFRRDWEQTKADMPGQHGHLLNQNIGDTLGQAFGSRPVLSLDQKTHPNTPGEAAKETAMARETMVKADATIASARANIFEATTGGEKLIVTTKTDLEAERKTAQETILRSTTKADEAIAKAKARMGDEAVRSSQKIRDVQDTLAAHEVMAVRRIADMKDALANEVGRENQRIVDATAKREQAIGVWHESEREARYGFAAHSQYASRGPWNDTLEKTLETEWAGLKTGRTWTDSKAGIRQGWDLAAKDQG